MTERLYNSLLEPIRTLHFIQLISVCGDVDTEKTCRTFEQLTRRYNVWRARCSVWLCFAFYVEATRKYSDVW